MILLYQKFISKIYIKNFLIILFAVGGFFTSIDLLQNLKNLPDSANLQILYGVYKFLNSISYVLPISLIFAMLMTIFQLIRTNELVSLYSLGISKFNVLKPILIISLIITLFYISLNSTNFINSDEYAKNIKKFGDTSRVSSNIFLKSFDTYIYIGELNQIKQIAKNLKIFITKDNDLEEIIEAKQGYFEDNHWVLEDVLRIKKPKLNNKITTQKKLIFKKVKNLNILHGFQPNIMDNLFKNRTFLTIQDSYKAVKFLKKQNLNANKAKANLYMMTIYPLFAPLLIVILFYKMPISSRLFNQGLVTFIFFFISLILWGVLFAMIRASLNGAILPEIGIILPIFLLLCYALYMHFKRF